MQVVNTHDFKDDIEENQYYPMLDIRNASKSSKFSPMNSTALTTLTISNPFITNSWTTGGYSSTERMGAGKSSWVVEATEATDATAAATSGM